MYKLRKPITLCLISLVVLSGCTQQPGIEPTNPPQSSANTSTKSFDQGSTSALPSVNPVYPGPYKTVVVDGVEMKQGRFEPGQFGNTLVRSMVGSDPKVFNPWTASDTQSRELGSLMFAGLVGVDPYTGDVIPDMASELTISPDELTYTTQLRKGLKWSDGKPITADDVAFTWNIIIKEGYGNSSLRDVTTIDGKSPTVVVVDELTNKFVTPKPFAPFARLLSMPIAPQHIVEPIIKTKNGREAFQQLWSANTDPKSLVTSGPFVLSRYVPSQRVELVATKNYYMVNKLNKRLPYLAKLVYQIVPDVNTNLLKFKAKEIDLTIVRNRDAAELLSQQENDNFKLYNLGQSIGTTFLMFNMNQRTNPKTSKPYVDPVKSLWFNDVNFRQAINHTINRDNMVANYFKGIGFPLYTSEPPSSPYWNQSLKGFPADTNYAMTLLEKSGFQKKPDGFLYDKNNNKVEFDMLAASGGTFYEAIGNMIVEDLKRLGIKVNFQMLNFNILSDKIDHSLDWQACLMALSPGDPLEPNDGANVYKSDGRLHVFDQRLPDESGIIKVSDARPWETRLDEIFNVGAQSLDKSKRKQLYNEYQQIIFDEAPFVFLVSPTVLVAARNTLGNYQPTQLSQSAMGLHNMEELYKK
ncbi:MAG: ABC transporter substrate-binding protein [Candidatus Melainabacteria bacterium]|nr:ABC transporter substrate-binding protein [Candidatus Melainabacteria bacterium]